jgi:hypothetical protein
MMNLLFALCLIALVLWAAKKFYFPTEIASHPELYAQNQCPAMSRKDMGILFHHLQRWRDEGKVTREEFDQLTDLCLSEIQEASQKE